jgi:hypothetical protein
MIRRRRHRLRVDRSRELINRNRGDSGTSTDEERQRR